MVFELHQDDTTSKYFVKVRYNGDYMDLCQSKAKECDFDEFQSRVKRNFIDFNSLCPTKVNDADLALSSQIIWFKLLVWLLPVTNY